MTSFDIGYIYSFVAAGVFYWAFNKLSPHTESMLDQADTGEEIIAANDAKNVAAAKERRGTIVGKVFDV
jgi:NCS1 family nucleobase:cation symporter-1